MEVSIVDPCVNRKEAFIIHKIQIEKTLNKFLDTKFTIIVGVNHDFFINISAETYKKILIKNGIIFDINNFIPKEMFPLRI